MGSSHQVPKNEGGDAVDESADLEELEALVELLSGELRDLNPGTDTPSGSAVDDTELTGSSGQAQENRAIHLSRARMAAHRAQRVREPLPELADRARAGLERIRRQREQGRKAAARPHGAEDVDTAGAGSEPDSALHRVVCDAAEHVPGIGHATLILWDEHGRVERSLASDDVGTELIGIQSRIGQGPCVDAATDGRTVEAPDLDGWPWFGSAVAGLGVRGVVAVPLRCGRTTGALALWTDETGAFPASTGTLGEMFARYATTALAHAAERGTLREAVARRDVIGQAKGMLMLQQGLDAEAAFRMLVQRSQHTNVKLADVARSVVDTATDRDAPSG